MASLLVYAKTRTVSSCLTITLRCESQYILKGYLHWLQILMEGNTTSTPEELVDSLIERRNDYGGTNFDGAIRMASIVLENQWDPQR